MKRQTVKNPRHNKSDIIKKKTTKRSLDKKRFFTILAAAFFLLYFIYVMIVQQIEISSKNKEIKVLEEKINIATEQTEELKKQMENLDDPEYLEKVAREKLGLIRPNERVFIDTNKDE